MKFTEIKSPKNKIVHIVTKDGKRFKTKPMRIEAATKLKKDTLSRGNFYGKEIESIDITDLI